MAESWQKLVGLARTREILADAADWAVWEEEMRELDSSAIRYWDSERG